jgi:hypothetical protein
MAKLGEHCSLMVYHRLDYPHFLRMQHFYAAVPPQLHIFATNWNWQTGFNNTEGGATWMDDTLVLMTKHPREQRSILVSPRTNTRSGIDPSPCSPRVPFGIHDARW